MQSNNATATAQEKIPANSPATVAARVLLVMSEPTLRLAVLDRLRVVGLEVEVAGTGGLAVDKLRRSRIDAVLLDLGLSEESSIDVIKLIRRDPEFSDLAIYGIAGADSAKLSRKAVKAGAWRVFDLGSGTLDLMIAEIGGILLAGENNVGELVELGPGDTTEPPLADSIHRVLRHLEHLAAGSQLELASSYGELRAKVQLVIKIAMLDGRYDIARLATNLAALLKLLHETPDHATTSTVRTVRLASGVLQMLVEGGPLSGSANDVELKATVIDDEMVSRSVVCSALRSVRLKFEVFGHPSAALRHVIDHRTDLVVVNLGVKEVGFEFSDRLREQAQSGSAPVLYVSGVNEFEALAPEGLHEDDELIARPFIFVELAVRALSLAMKSRHEQKGRHPRPASGEAAANEQAKEVSVSHPRPATSVPPDMLGALAAASPRQRAQEEIAMVPDKPAAQIPLGVESRDVVKPLPRDRAGTSGVGTGETAFYSKNFEAKLLNEVMGWLVVPDVNEGADSRSPENIKPVGAEAQEPGREELSGRSRYVGAEVRQLVEELRREKEQRQQLESFVQQLMENQGTPAGTPGRGAGAPAAHPLVEASEEIQEELQSLSTLADELRVELEASQREREELLKRIDGNQTEIKLLAESLARERQQRESLNARLKDANSSSLLLDDRGEELARAICAAEQAAAAAQVEIDRNQKLEAELKLVLDQNRELRQRIEGNQPTSDAAQQKTGSDLQVETLQAEVDQAREVANRLTEEKERLEKELEARLDAAREEAAEATASHRRELERVQLLEQDVSGSKQRIAELESRENTTVEALAAAETRAREATEAHAAQKTELADLGKRQDETEARLAEATAKLSENDRHTALVEQRARELDAELQRSRALSGQAEAHAARVREIELEMDRTRKLHEQTQLELETEKQKNSEAVGRREELGALIAGLEKERDEALQQLATEREASARLASTRAELDDLLEEARRAAQEAEVARSEMELTSRRIQEEAVSRATRAEETAREAELTGRREKERADKFESEVTQLWKTRDELKARLEESRQRTEDVVRERSEAEGRLQEAVANLDKATAELDDRNRRMQAAESQCVKLAETNATLSAELALLQEQRKAHAGELAALERRVNDSVSQLTRSTADLETERGERRRIEQRASTLATQLRDLRGELNQQLQLEKDLQARVTGIEQQLREREQALQQEKAAHETERAQRRQAEQKASTLATGLEAAGNEINGHLRTARESQERVSRLEQQLRAREESLVRVTEHLEAERGERRRVEERAGGITSRLHEQQAKVAVLEQSVKDHAGQVASLSEKLEDRDTAYAKLNAQLENERNERQQIEQRAVGLAAQLKELHDDLNDHLEAEKGYQGRIAELEQCARDREEALTHLQSELEKEAADRTLAEEQVRAAGDFGSKLQQYQTAFEEARGSFEQNRTEMERGLHEARTELIRREEHLEQVEAQRRQIEQELATVRREAREQSQQNAVELSRLKSELQVVSLDRQRLEGDALNSRFVSLNHSRSSRALINGYRRKLQAPVDTLMASACRLLEHELSAEVKQVAETVLEKAISLQTSMRDSAIVESHVNEPVAKAGEAAVEAEDGSGNAG